MPAKTRHRSKQAAAAAKPALQNANESTASSSEQRPETSAASNVSQPIKLDQSTQLVQSLFHAGISCVAFLRQLFPDNCFTRRTYENRHDHWDYDEWASGKKGLQSSKQQRPGAAVSILKRGEDKGVDHLLDWLEKGVFHALKKRYLETFQFIIIENEGRPSEVLETYDFRVRYTESLGAELVQISMPGLKPTSIWNARVGFTQMIKKLCMYCPNLADLPKQRSLKIQLSYNATCPNDYEPPGFMTGGSDSLAFPSGDGWTRKTVSMGEMDTGYHSLALSVNHLEHEDPSMEAKIPSNLNYTDVASIIDNADGEFFELEETTTEAKKEAKKGSSSEVANQPSDAPQSSGEASKTGNPERSHNRRENLQSLDSRSLRREQPGVQPSKDTEHAGGSLEPSAHSGKVDKADRSSVQDDLPQQVGARNQSETRVRSSSTIDHESPDVSERNFLRNMLQDTPADEGSLDTQPIMLTPEELEPQATSAHREIGLQLSEEKLSALVRESQRGMTSSPLKRHSTGLDLQGLGSVDRIRCECDWSREDPEQMLQCHLCENWQHSYCYGYRGRSDRRVPKDRICYRCLTVKEDPKMFPALRSLALMRCGIRYIERFGFIDDSKFAAGLEIDRQTASRLSGHLREKGYLVPVTGQKKHSRAHHIVKSGPAYQRMIDECFAPFKWIEHLYVPQEKANEIEAPISAAPSRSEAPKTLTQAGPSSQPTLATSSLRKGKQRATATATEQGFSSASNQQSSLTRAKAPVASLQTPSRKRRSQESWLEEVGRRVTPKRACKSSVSAGFIKATYLTSPASVVASVNPDDDEMEL
ncbi:HORMA domain-containing protein [Phyllosticta citribraziliensis]|uniref:HORMA domain-containing protein n=1 Tax=Phyllosticta citribraziliensis TaxID=989973 RepID=A0ABR1L6G4_9PEZI